MFESNAEIIAKNMPDENTVLILKKDLQTHNGVVSKGTRVVLRQFDTLCDGYEVILSDTFCYIYLRDIIRNNESSMLSFEVSKYPQRIQKFVKEYFMIDFDRTKEYKSYLEKKHINVGIILFMILWFVGLIAISIFGWLEDAWCNTGISILPSGNIVAGILCNVLFGGIWCVLGLMGITIFGISAIQSISRKNEKK